MTRTQRAIAVAVALLAVLAFAPDIWHLPIGVVGWVLIRWQVADVHRTLGRPIRWLQALVVLVVLGALLGSADYHVLSVGVSKAGALSATTMVVRAFALIALTSLLSSVLPIRRWAEGIRHPLARRLVEVVVVAVNLVPVQLRALSTASNTLKERRPGLARLPKRLWLMSVHTCLHAAMLAESIAFDMAIAAHNTSNGKEPS